MTESGTAITHRASVSSEHFSYEGYGDSPDVAREVLMKGLCKHAAQMGTAPDWPEEVVGGARIEIIGGGLSTFRPFDALEKARIVDRGVDGDVLYRAVTEAYSGDAWGDVDGYGATAGEAMEAATSGSRTVGGKGPEIDDAVIREDMTVYAVRSGGAYRGGLVGSAGEPLLDDHLEPKLPDGDESWLPTVRLRIVAIAPDGTKATGEAIGRPSRENRKQVYRFLEDAVPPALDAALTAIVDPEQRLVAEEMVYEEIPRRVVKAFFDKIEGQDYNLIDLPQGGTVELHFSQEETTASSLVVR